ncbi:MAG TPA: nuclear transport factor 2 family protein [Solirubrobacteraceae bacterium]|nr:nuclear transport factor 2 family protein [Solirubrobacteraceae bacterium]
MSHKNVKLVRKALDAYTRRDVETLRTVADPDMELDWSASRGWLADVYRGIDQALRFYEGYFEAFDFIEIKPDRFIVAGDSVVVPNVAHQRGRDGIEVSARSTLVFTVRNRKLIRICLYQEMEQALEAVGLTAEATPQPNVEIIKRAIDAFNRRDVDLIADLTTPDFEWFPALPGNVEGGGYRGREGIETYLGEIRDTWEELRLFGDEFRDLGEGVLVLGRAEGRGRGSGAPVAASHGFVAEFRGEKLSRVRTYLDHDDALRAAGLAE